MLLLGKILSGVVELRNKFRHSLVMILCLFPLMITDALEPDCLLFGFLISQHSSTRHFAYSCSVSHSQEKGQGNQS